MTPPDASIAVRERVHAAARRMLPESEDIGRSLAQYIRDRVVEIGDSEIGDMLVTMCQNNTRMIAEALIRGVSVDDVGVPDVTISSTRSLVEGGLPLHEMVRAYRVGSQYWVKRWAELVAEVGTPDETSIDAVAEGISYLLAWLDLATHTLADEYREESERLSRESAFARSDYIRIVLDDEHVDVENASIRIGYRLRGRHVAFVIRGSSNQPASRSSLTDVVASIARAVGPARPLATQVDMYTTWCWVPCPDGDRVDVSTADFPFLIGQGRPGAGVTGFRRSHREARDALAVAELRPHISGTTRYDDVEVASLCTADLARCRQFVDDQLGSLAEIGPRADKRRHTLETFLTCNSNFRATAAVLDLHHNTVRYRLEQIERELGRRIAESRLPLELALHLAATLGPRLD